jgi:P4 family phage/plasmid primase-like protien
LSPASPPLPDDALRFTRALWQPGDVREVRILKYDRFGHTASGHFDAPEKLVEAAAAWDGKANVYMTINATDPALLARANNRIVAPAQSTTADGEVARRSWLLLDIDPVHPSGISSTDNELAEAETLLQAATGHLAALGWPAPITCLSGNGYHALFPIELPNTADVRDTVQNVLESLAARFNTPAATIDTTVANASRIACLIGTTKMKGDPTVERPHRRSRLLRLPAELMPVPPMLLAEVAKESAGRSRGARATFAGATGPIAELLDAAGIDYREQRPDANGSVWYHVRECPFHGPDRPYECGVGQAAEGTYMGKCFHPAGVGTGWQEWKAALRLGATARPLAGSTRAKTEDAPSASHHCTDSGNAERLIDYCGDRVRYCASDTAWYVYDGLRWAQDTTLHIEDLAGEALRGIYDETRNAGDSDLRQKLGRWALASEAAARRRAAVEIARSDRRLAIRPSDLNRDGWLLNCLNGTLDLRCGELRPHDPADLISKLAPVPYDPAASSKLWVRVLAEATGHDEDYLRHIQRFLGYCLTAEVSAEYFAVAIGGTETTKSTVLGPVRKVMGDYAADVEPETFCTRDRVGSTRDDLLRLAGVRLALIPEADKRRHLDEAMLKRFVSGEGWPVRGVYQRDRDLHPVAKVVFHTNEMPQMSDDDDAVWRRALSWPFTHRPEHIDTTIKPTLLDLSVSGPAILAWLVEGCRAWQHAGGAKKGLGRATTVDQAKDALRRSMNPLADFFDEVCVFDEPLWCSRSRLRTAYTDWCKAGNARRPIGTREFNTRLRSRGVIDQTGTEHGRGVDGWREIGLKGRPT